MWLKTVRLVLVRLCLLLKLELDSKLEEQAPVVRAVAMKALLFEYVVFLLTLMLQQLLLQKSMELEEDPLNAPGLKKD